jgi:centromere protein C
MKGLQYADEIYALRRTGLTMEERQRDEYGMEEVDGLFSSPEKSPAKLNGFSHVDDETASSEMSIEDGRLAKAVCPLIYYQLVTDMAILLCD